MALASELDEPASQQPSTPGRSWRPVFLGLALAAVGVAGLLASSSIAGPTARVIGGNIPLSAGATDRLDVLAHNSPTLVANPKDPTNLVIVNRVDHPQFSCSLQVSFDGGANWDLSPIPLPDAKEIGCFSPDAAFGANGTLYLSFTSFAPIEGLGTVPDAVWVVTSDDGGRTISPPVPAGGPSAYQVRLVADPARDGRLYLIWIEARRTTRWGFDGTDNPVLVSRSDDGGAIWSAPVRVSPAARQRVVAPSPAIGAGGELYLAYLDLGDDRLDYAGAHDGLGGEPYPGTWSLVVARSADGGATWQEAVVEPRLVPTRRFIQVFPPVPSVTVDRSGRIYVGFEHARQGDADVWVWSSADGGRRWGAGRRVNDTPRDDGRSQYLAALAVSPGGRLDVVYYDRRSDPKDLANSVSLQSSFDEGRTFTARLPLTDRPFDSRIGFGRDRDIPELGSRLALLSTDGGALAVWTDTRAGNAGLPKQVLARALVRISPAGSFRSLRPLLVALSIAVMGLAAAVWGRWWLRRRGLRARSEAGAVPGV